ncbi:universal stress protein [Larkinella sp. VNQ87]|uniref:universal stress protein n=1 Tax=Larkinella sp. VNQ87 TaxID=3400921 RepID=UPI003C05491D
MKKSIIHKILVPVDYSEASTNALSLAIAMCQRHEAQLRLLHVINPHRYSFNSVALGANLWASVSLEEAVEADNRQLHQWAEDRLRDQSIRYSVECRAGAAIDRLAEAAEEFSADLIVMDAQTTSGLLQYVFGSTAYHAIKEAPCLVLTVPEKAQINAFREILFPVRPVPGAMTKYDLARTIAQRNRAHLTVLGLFSQEDSEEIKLIGTTVLSLNKQLVSDTIDAEVLLWQTDSAVKAVLKQAEERDADLIIVTADNATSDHRLFSGPFYKQLVNRSPIPVLSIKPRETMPKANAQNKPLTMLPTFRPFLPALPG